MSTSCGWPSVTTVLKHMGFYAKYPIEEYYLERGHWTGACADILAMGGELDEATIAYGRKQWTKPRSNGVVECWGDYVDGYQKLINSPDFKARFTRCLGVQETVVCATYRHIGHRDQRWEMIGGGEALFDTKSGKALPMTGLQLAGYDCDHNGKKRRRFAVEMTPTEAKLIEFTDGRHYAAFHSMVQAMWWFRELS